MPNYRNPNGWGSVVKLSGRRRNPFVARKTVGYDDRAYPIYQTIGYFPSREKGMIALAEYNHNPYDLDFAKVTFKSLYDKWEKEELKKQTISVIKARKTAIRHCEALYSLPYKGLRKHHFQSVIDNSPVKSSGKAQIRALLVDLDQYAYDLDIIQKKYTEGISAGKQDETKDRVLFTDEEVKLLWEHRGEKYIDETLFQLYTGCRVSEMLSIRCENVDLEAGIMRGGVKTAAGKNRIIPIHSQLRPVIEAHLSGKELLFAGHPDANSYAGTWKNHLKKLGLNHTTHECRHTFRSKLDSAGANKVAIDRIMGHKSRDVGERVYTHKTIEELKQAIELLKY